MRQVWLLNIRTRKNQKEVALVKMKMGYIIPFSAAMSDVNLMHFGTTSFC